jgi:hypothetical protein
LPRAGTVKAHGRMHIFSKDTMALSSTDFPVYKLDGFDVRIHVAERRDGLYSSFYNVNSSCGGSCEVGYRTERDAHVAAMAAARERISYMIAHHPGGIDDSWPAIKLR